MYNILAIDDEQHFLDSIVGLFKYQNYIVDTLTNPTIALETLSKKEYACILLDVKMPGIDGIELLEQIMKSFPEIPVIMISAQSSLSIAVNSIKKGAYDFIEKGADTDRLLITLQNAIEKRNWVKQRSLLLNELYDQFQMIGKSSALQHVFSQIETIAPTEAKVLISGETGTGKELVARAIHLHSSRATKPYIKVNCAAIPDTLIESTFFGHKRGSFSGAFNEQKGKFEQANEGTIFLDEIGELNLQAQAKLLRVLDDGEIEKIGEAHLIKTDVRVIAATNKNLLGMVRQGHFRMDLYHRLKVIEIKLPPLRKRLEDIPLLAQYFLKRYSEKYNKSLREFTSEALNILMKQEWPGNIRMFKNIIEKTAIFAQEPLIRAEHITLALNSENSSDINLPKNMHIQDFLDMKEKEFIERALLLSGGKKQAAAEMVGVDRATLWRKIQKYNIRFSEENQSI